MRPGRTYCDGYGYCYNSGPYWVQGRIYTVDVNAPLRQKLTDQCMAKQGYAPARIPLCPPGTADYVPPAATTKLPPLSDKSCVIKYKNGAFQIIDLA